MDDLTLTKLCAEAMGIAVYVDAYGDLCLSTEDHDGSNYHYWPITNDAQAMALVKKFEIHTQWHQSGVTCRIYDATKEGWPIAESDNADLNRCICETVAKLQAPSDKG